MARRQEKIEGGLIGLLVGDALGVPYEFHPREEMPVAAEIEFAPPAGFRRAHAGVRPGTWSDDGAQALCLLDSLLERGAFDPEDFARRMLRWYDKGYMAVNNRVFDVGITTGRALQEFSMGTPAVDAGPREQHNCGNGALMRILPLALWHRGTDDELARDAHLQSRVTHGHMRSQVCCALYVLWARNVLEETDDPWRIAVKTLRSLYTANNAATEELEWSVRPDAEPEGDGSGYVVDCLRSARWAVEQGPYEKAVKAAVGLGDDTDTTACVAGGIAGMRDGIGAIPERWRDGLRGREIVEPLLHKLLARE